MSSHSTKIIAICGGSGSGKTTLAYKLLESITSLRAIVIGQDSYYFDQSKNTIKEGEGINFDHPSALDFSLLSMHLSELKKGKSVNIPIYDYVSHSRKKEVEPLNSQPYIILDGTLLLSQEAVRKHIDFSVFLDIPEEIRFNRRLHRDVIERGRTKEGVINQFYKQVKPMHDQYVQPSKKHADIVFSYGFDQDKAVVSILNDSLKNRFDKACQI